MNEKSSKLETARHAVNVLPEVVAALEFTLNRIDLLHDRGKGDWEAEDAEVFNQARVVLAKATGEAKAEACKAWPRCSCILQGKQSDCNELAV